MEMKLNDNAIQLLTRLAECPALTVDMLQKSVGEDVHISITELRNMGLIDLAQQSTVVLTNKGLRTFESLQPSHNQDSIDELYPIVEKKIFCEGTIGSILLKNR